jgi:hypothetical protein
MDTLWPWVLMALLGAYHGLNPAMGWLFAVALGMQERDRGAVLRALPPIALGHEASVVVAAALVLGLGLLADTSALHMGAGIALVLFGVFRFIKPRAHFRWVKARVSRGELAWWSFLMSTAHGAGLMVAPVLLGAGVAGEAEAQDHTIAAVQEHGMSIPGSGVAVLLHVGAMVAVMGAIAVLVYDRWGLSVLQRTWINLDAVWAGAFVVAGVVTFFT